MKPTIVAVDLSAIFYQAYHATANDQITVSQQYHNCTVATISKVNHIRTLNMGLESPRIVICCDDRKNWRKDIDRTYKAQREKQDAGFYDALERCKERLIKDGFPLLQVEGFEADDVIASLCYVSQSNGISVIVASPDKDLLQLVTNSCPTVAGVDCCSVRQLRTHKMFLDDDVTVKLYDEAMVEAEFGVTPRKLADYLAIVGDKSDNISGIYGVGGTAAPLILKEFGSLNGLLSAVEKRDEERSESPWATMPSLSRCASKLTAFFKPDESGKAYLPISNLARNRILVGLKSDIPIDMDDVLRERKVETLSRENEDTMGLDENQERQMDMAQDAEFSMPALDLIDKVSSKPTDTQKQQATTAIATVAPRSVAMQQFTIDLMPTGMEAVYWFAKRANDSRNYLKKFGNEDACLMAIMNGKRFGLDMVASLEKLNVIEGKACLPAEYMLTLSREDKDCEYFDVVESDDKHCIVETKRRSDGKVFRVDFNISEAERAGLVKPNSNWVKWPIDMCFSRAVSRLSRRIWTRAVGGCNSIEEMSDER